MTTPSPAHSAICHILASAWDPQVPPPLEPIPWPDVLRLALAGDVAPALYTLSRQARLSLPPAVQHELEQAHYRAINADTRCLHQLAQVWAALSALGVPLLLLKGAALDAAFYQDLAPRQIGDIDLLVPVESVPACRQALLDLGYLPSLLEHRPGDMLVRYNQQQFIHSEPDQVPVELHWHILDIPYYLRRLPMDWFWQNTEELVIAGRLIRVLNPAANMVYLPAHLAFHHGLPSLRSLLDLALLVVQDGARSDWPAIVAAAHRFELVSALRAALDQLAQCWPSLPLDAPLRLLGSVQLSPTDARLFRLLTAEPRSAMLVHYTTLVSLPGFPDKARYAWVTLFPQYLYMQKRYSIKSRWQLPYWYLHRLVVGLFRFITRLPQARGSARRSG